MCLKHVGQVVPPFHSGVSQLTYFWKKKKRKENVKSHRSISGWLTCTRDSGRLIFSATSSRMNMSGYRVLANNASKTSSCARVKVVLSRLCFRGVAVRKKRNVSELNYITYVFVWEKKSDKAKVSNSIEGRCVTQNVFVVFVFVRNYARVLWDLPVAKCNT